MILEPDTKVSITLIINEEEQKVQLVISDDLYDGIDPLILDIDSAYHGLRKWNPLISALDRKFGQQIGQIIILGEDLETHSYQTFEYSEGIWVHVEPCEFLIDLVSENVNTEEEQKLIRILEDLIEECGYRIRYYDHNMRRLSVWNPFERLLIECSKKIVS